MVEHDAREGDFHRLMGADEPIVGDGPGNRGNVTLAAGVFDDDDAFDARQRGHDLRDAGEGVDLLPGIEVAIGANEHLRLDLAEAVHGTLDTEVRRGRGPDGAEARGRQHRDDRLGQIGEIAGDPVACSDALRVKGLSELRRLVVERAMTQTALQPVLTPKDQGIRIVAVA
jgi:hypothetical protein